MKNSNSFIQQISSTFSAKMIEEVLDIKAKATEAKSIADAYDNNKEYKDAMRFYKIASSYGDSDATYMVGNYYEEGYSGIRNKSLAYIWYQRGANQGNIECLKRMAIDYYCGSEFCPQDTETAKEYCISIYLKKPGLINEIELNKYFPGWKKEENKGFDTLAFKPQKQLMNIAEWGIVAAFYWLGVNMHGELLSNDLKVILGYETNVDKARRWLLKAALEDYSPAASYLKQHFGIDVNEASSGEEMYICGCNYPQDSSEQNKDLRFFWLRKAVDSGYEEACNNLGVCYDCAIGTERSYFRANKLYLRAIEHNDDATAFYNYGLNNFYGNGLGKNESLAKKLFLKARIRGSEHARDFLKEHYGIDKSIGIEFSDSSEAVIFDYDGITINYCGIKTSEKGFQIRFSCENNTGISYELWVHNLKINGVTESLYKTLGEFSPDIAWHKKSEVVHVNKLLGVDDIIELSVEIDDDKSNTLCETNTIRITFDKNELEPCFEIIGPVIYPSLRLKEYDKYTFDDEEYPEDYEWIGDSNPLHYLQCIDYSRSYHLLIEPEYMAELISNQYTPKKAKSKNNTEYEDEPSTYNVFFDNYISTRSIIQSALKYL